MDSREYAFIYPLRAPSDIPGDFPPEVRNLHFETGVFLPQDDSKWFARAPQYPPRLLLLDGRYLRIVPHPTAEESPAEIDLDRLVQIESATLLLHGWFKFMAVNCVQEIFYNARASRPLAEFLQLLKRRWLETIPRLPAVPTQAYGDPVDIKFRNAVSRELIQDEAVLLQFFQAPILTNKNLVLFKRESWRAGSLLLLTSMNRLIWITDESKRRRNVYASISYSTALSAMQTCKVESEAAGPYRLSMCFGSSVCWKIPIDRAIDECSLFCRQLNAISACAAHAGTVPLLATKDATKSDQK